MTKPVSIKRFSCRVGQVVVLPMLLLQLLGCAAGPSIDQVSRVEDDKPAFSSQENVDAGVDVRGDFETALNYLRTGDYKKGTDLLNQVAQRSRGNAAPYINLAIAYQKMGNLPAAEESVKKALQIDPGHPVASTEYALICRKSGRFAEARKIYEETLTRHPDFLPARKNLGILCDIYLSDLDCALKQYRVYSAGAPDDKTVPLWIADLEKRLGKPAH
ncbi:MAG: tetratricopeptide repeat protein [Sulfurifustis sp.]